jgi:hypothetical protein
LVYAAANKKWNILGAILQSMKGAPTMRVLTPADHEAICRALIDQGKLVEAGFESLRFLVMAADAPEVQVSEMRMAFFAGAQHVFASIVSMLEPGAEATDNDLMRMSLIQIELEIFVQQSKARLRKSAG